MLNYLHLISATKMNRFNLIKGVRHLIQNSYRQTAISNRISQSSLLSTTSKHSQEAPSKCDDKDNPYLNDMPDPTLNNPYFKEKRQCLLCKYKVDVDYKNVRLLSQFISPHTGRQYDKNITGLCEYQHQVVYSQLKKARALALMAFTFRDPKFNVDPKLYDPARPQRPNPL